MTAANICPSCTNPVPAGEAATVSWEAMGEPDEVWHGSCLLAERVGYEDLVGVVEAARIAGLSESSIRTYVRRGTLPDPLPVVGSDALVWERSAIERWARERPGPGRRRA